MIPMAGKELTQKQETFALAFVETGNASEAYRRAYSAGKMKPETIHKRASELLATGEVTGRVQILQAEHQERHNTTVDSISDQLDDDRKLAHGEGQAGAAVQASMGKAKLHGLLTDKTELTGKDGGPLETSEVSNLEIACRLVFTLEQGARSVDT